MVVLRKSSSNLHHQCLRKRMLKKIKISVEEKVPLGAPELPESGLPEGWTMEQWAHYGQAWIDQQNES